MNEKPKYRCDVVQLPSGRWKYWILHNDDTPMEGESSLEFYASEQEARRAGAEKLARKS